MSDAMRIPGSCDHIMVLAVSVRITPRAARTFGDVQNSESRPAHLDLRGTRGTTPADATPYAIMLQAAMWHCVRRIGYLREPASRRWQALHLGF